MDYIGNYDTSAKLYQSVLGMDPNHVKALNNYAIVLDRLGQSEEALNYFYKLLKV